MAEESVLRQRRPHVDSTSDQRVAARHAELSEPQCETRVSDNGSHGRGHSPSVVPLQSTFRKNVEIHEKPRQIVLAGLMISGVGFASYLYEESDGPDVLARRCLFTSLWIICCYCVVQARDTVMVRPHPAFWRLFHGVALWYLAVLPIFAIVPLSTAKAILRATAPEIKKDLPESVLGYDHLNCELTLENLTWHVTSFWTAVHFIGWFGKFIVYRNWHTCLLISTFFEFIELSLQFAIPEFKECWWDSVILDWGGANILGMALGSLTLKCFTCIEYSWKPWKEVRGAGPTVKRWLQHFLPYSLASYRWHDSQTIRSYLMQFTMLTVGLIAELITFLISMTLKFRCSHPLILSRAFFMLVWATPSIHEWHLYGTGVETRLGYNVWILTIILILELSIFIRYSISMGLWAKAMNETPPGIYCPWAIFFAVQLIYIAMHKKLQGNAEKSKLQWKMPTWLRYLRFSSMIPLLWLTRYYG